MGMRREYGGMAVLDDHVDTGYDLMLEKQTRTDKTKGCACPSRPPCRTSFLAREQKEALQRLDNFDFDLDLLVLAINDVMFDASLLLHRRHHDRVGFDVIIRPCTS